MIDKIIEDPAYVIFVALLFYGSYHLIVTLVHYIKLKNERSKNKTGKIIGNDVL